MQGSFFIRRKEKKKMSGLEKYSTKELVEELENREGVEKTTAAPYDEKSIEVNGPAVVLTIID